MQDSFDKKLGFVVTHYEEGKYDTEKAVRRLHHFDSTVKHRRWLISTAAAAASIVVALAAGYGFYKVTDRPDESQTTEVQAVTLNPDVAVTHVFVYEDAPLADVLTELSDYFGRTLKSSPSEKHLTATFPDEDLDLIVSIIESVLDIDITVE